MIPPPGSAEVLPPSRTVVARLYLPMEMGAFGRILAAVASEFPDAVVGEPDAEGEVVIWTGPVRPLPGVGPSEEHHL